MIEVYRSHRMKKKHQETKGHDKLRREKRKRRYDAPAVVDEQTFETMVLGCNGSNPFCGSPTS